MNAAKVEMEINSYLSSLNLKQKKAVLTVVKKIAESQDDSGYSDEFKKELDSRYEDIMAGKNLISEEEVKERIQKIIKGGKKK